MTSPKPPINAPAAHQADTRADTRIAGDRPQRDTRSLRDYIRTIVDFPKEGILFRDVTTAPRFSGR